VLNEFQSFALQRFTSSNRNLVVLAPTGVGKTFFAQYVSSLAPSSVLYAVPLKSLVYEIVDRFNSVFFHGENAVALLSEAYEEEPEDVRAKVIVSSYEKSDGVTRRNYKWLDNVKLLVVDEIHNLSYKERSRAIENLVMWAKDNNVRVLAMSGTLPWADQLSSWLDADLVRWDKRPVPLFKFVQVGNTLVSSDGEVISVKGDLMRKLVKRNKVVMIFANTRKRAETLYMMYSRVLGDRVAYVHSGLDPGTRKRIIQDTLQGRYNVLVSTTALGQGVNLPFYAVIFDDLRLPVVEEGHFVGWRHMDPLEFDQICGRAGRPGFDEEGMCIIHAENMKEAKLLAKRYLAWNPPPLDTRYPLKDMVLVVMSRLVYAPLDRIVKNVRYSYTHRGASEKEVESILDSLVDHGFVASDGDGYSITGKGIAVSYSYIDVDTAFYYIDTLETGRNFKEAILSSVKVQESAKGKNLAGVLEAWVTGVDEKFILNQMENFTRSDLLRFVDTVAWQAFSLYRLAKVLDKGDANAILRFYMEVKHGVPFGALSLVELPGIGRKHALDLYNAGVHNKRELCEKLDVTTRILGDKVVKYLCRQTRSQTRL
jgi:helicase